MDFVEACLDDFEEDGVVLEDLPLFVRAREDILFFACVGGGGGGERYEVRGEFDLRGLSGTDLDVALGRNKYP